MIREILKMGDERLLRIAPPVPPEMFDSPELWQLIDALIHKLVGGGQRLEVLEVDLRVFAEDHIRVGHEIRHGLVRRPLSQAAR